MAITNKMWTITEASRKRFLNSTTKNSFNIPYWENEDGLQKKNKLGYIIDCPVCGKKMIYDGCIQSVCGWCGFDVDADNKDEYKNKFDAIINENPDFIWGAQIYDENYKGTTEKGKEQFKKFAKITNHENIPGYTEESLNEELKYPYYINISNCPICGKKTLGESHICCWCGIDPEADTLFEYKKFYMEQLEKDPDWFFENYEYK